MELTSTEIAVIAKLLEDPKASLYGVAKELNLRWHVVARAIKKLNERGYMRDKVPTNTGLNAFKDFREIINAPVERSGQHHNHNKLLTPITLGLDTNPLGVIRKLARPVSWGLARTPGVC